MKEIRHPKKKRVHPSKCKHSLCEERPFEDGNCIFHCEKDLSNGWCTLSNDKYTKFNGKVYKFWSEFVRISNQHAGDISFRYDEFIVPYYHSNLSHHDSRIQIQKIPNLNFNRCKFVDPVFVSNITSEELTIYRPERISGIYVFDSNIKRVCIAQAASSSNIRFLRSEMHNFELDQSSFDGEVYVAIEESKINHRVDVKELTGKDLLLKISGCTINDLLISDLKISKCEIDYHTKISDRLSISKSEIDSVELSELSLEKQAAWSIDTCSFKRFAVNGIVNNCELIQLNDVSVLDAFSVQRFETKKAIFNNFNISSCSVSFSKCSLHDSVLNDIKWGENLSRIDASIDTIRQIKAAYDRISHYDAANMFYSEEMTRRRKELKQLRWLSNAFQSKLIFSINGVISNYGQSYVRPIFLIIVIAFLARFALINSIYDIFPNSDLSILDSYNCIMHFANELAASITPLKTLMIKDSEFGSIVFATIFSILLWHTYTSAKRYNKR
jgi:hypothetical protein